MWDSWRETWNRSIKSFVLWEVTREWSIHCFPWRRNSKWSCQGTRLNQFGILSFYDFMALASAASGLLSYTLWIQMLWGRYEQGIAKTTYMDPQPQISYPIMKPDESLPFPGQCIHLKESIGSKANIQALLLLLSPSTALILMTSETSV